MLYNCLLLVILVTIQPASSAGDGDVSYKTLQGEPSEFMNFSIPLKDREETSNTLDLPVVYLSAGLDWKYVFPVDPVDSIVVSVLYARAQMTDLTVMAVLTAPDGSQPKPDYDEVKPFSLVDDTSDAEVLVQQFLHPKPGKWQLVLSIKGHATAKPIKALAWISFNNSRACITAYTDNTDPLVGKDMDMNMMVPDPERKTTDGRSIPLPNMLRNATMTVTYPDGKEEVHVMYKEKTPGMMGGKFRPPTVGNYTVKLEVTGVDSASGYEFARSLTSTLSVAAPSLNVTGSISSDLYHHPVTGSEIILIKVEVKWDPQSRDTYRGYAEVYGTGNGGVSVPVAWVGGLMQVKQASSSSYMLQFELDSRWLVLANATFPLTLRNLTFEEIDGFIAVVKVQQLLKVSTRSPLIAQWRPMMKASDVDITYEMRNGYSPYRGKNYDSDSTTANSAGAIALVHGYCSDQPPFPSAHFTNPVVFSDLGKSRTIDAFARLIISFTAGLDLQRFSIVAHSQGGMAAVHMLTFFNTPLDGMVGILSTLFIQITWQNIRQSCQFCLQICVIMADLFTFYYDVIEVAIMWCSML